MTGIILIITAFILGLIVGSFLNVVIIRLHSGKSAVIGRSKCPQCEHVLSWFDLIPVLSFFLLKGKCRHCEKRISWQYPLVELATGILFAIVFFAELSAIGNDLAVIIDWRLIALVGRDWLAISALVVIFVYDLKWLIIPDRVVLPAIIGVIILNLLIGRSIAELAIGLAVGLGFFAVQYAMSRGTWIGGGDLRLGAFMGALLGWPLIAVALFMSYIIGGAAALVLLARGKVTAKSQVPFGVFLAPATIAALFWGQAILSWYLGRIN